MVGPAGSNDHVGKVLTIGLNTFREAIRNKVLYSLLFFAVLVIVASLAFGALSVHEDARLTTDLGLAGMSLFSVIIAIFVGVNLVYKELERKTIYSLIPKPIHRYQFVLGKFIGMVLTLAVLLAVMSVVLFVVLAIQDAPISAAVVKMAVLIFLEVVVVTAVAVFFSSFSTPFLSGLFTVGIFLVGRSVPDIRRVARKVQSPALRGLLRGVTRVVPDLRYFYVTGIEAGSGYISVHANFPDWGYVGHAALYATLCAAIVLMLAMALFARRDFV
jgi:ABC-type transport system involved in multi-copper enzyme maturation permease subunit